MPRMHFGCAGSGKSTLSLFNDTTDLLEQAIIPVTSMLNQKFEFTEEDVISAIEQFQHLKPAEKNVYLHGEWGGQKKEDTP